MSAIDRVATNQGWSLRKVPLYTTLLTTSSVICPSLASFSQVQKEEMRYKANVHHVPWLEARMIVATLNGICVDATTLGVVTVTGAFFLWLAGFLLIL